MESFSHIQEITHTGQYNKYSNFIDHIAFDLSGPGMWTSDAYGTITSHHIVAGFLGLLVGTLVILDDWLKRDRFIFVGWSGILLFLQLI